MKKIIFATGNQGKVKEVKDILGDLGLEILSMKEAGISCQIIEDGQTFEDNALIKAKAVSQECKRMADVLDEGGQFETCPLTSEELRNVFVFADDSGLEVDYLDKAPGVYSARFLGEDTSYDIKNQAILDKLKGVPDSERTARFVAAIAAVFPDGESLVTRGTIEGQIGYKMAGENGFGYDPIFYVAEFGCTTAELSPEEKNKVSHRARALVKMKELLKDKIA